MRKMKYYFINLLLGNHILDIIEMVSTIYNFIKTIL